MNATVVGIAWRKDRANGLQGEPALKASNCKFSVQQCMNCRTGEHFEVEVRRALSQGVVLLVCPQRPQQAKADGHFPKSKADGMHDYLADLEIRLVELFGGESATEMHKSTPVALVTGVS